LPQTVEGKKPGPEGTKGNAGRKVRTGEKKEKGKESTGFKLRGETKSAKNKKGREHFQGRGWNHQEKGAGGCRHFDL